MIYHFPAQWIFLHMDQTHFANTQLIEIKLPRWFKKCLCFGGITSRSFSFRFLSSFFNPVHFFSSFLADFTAHLQCIISCSDTRALLSITFLPSHLAGFLQTVTWGFFITSPGQNHSAVCSFRCCDKACVSTVRPVEALVETLARSSLAEAFCLPVLPPHPYFRQRLQCSQACWDCHLTRWFLNSFLSKLPC